MNSDPALQSLHQTWVQVLVFVIDGVNGLLFRAGDSEDLFKKIKTIIDSPSLITEFQKNIVLLDPWQMKLRDLKKYTLL